MKKQVTKIICATVAAVVACGVAAASGCSPYNKGVSLKYTSSNVKAESNGGFAVEKDGYVYFINGVGDSTAKNDYGTPVKGSIMRISTDNLKNRNYASVETLVPQIAYSNQSDYATGIFVYGDYIYYGTPSTKRNSDGVIQNDKLEMKSTKLDGSEAMKDAYVTFPSTSYDYRFVEVDGTVYLMYVATSESLYDESTGVKNLHSYNTKTGTNTLLAYNIDSYLFDAEDKTNPRVYYTMNVYDYSGTSNSAYSYNQVYTVTADETEKNEYDFDSVFGWDSDSDHYVNCGDLVFDGIGGKGNDSTPTQFNYKSDGSAVNNVAYSYTLGTYLNKTLFYTRENAISVSSSSINYFFSVKDSSVTSSWNPVTGNPEDDDAILDNASSVDQYKYIFDGDKLTSIIKSENGGGISVNKVTTNDKGVDKLQENIDNKNYFRIVKNDTATLLFVDGDYLYYSISGVGNGYTFFRVDYTGEWGDYERVVGAGENKYTAVQILDLDSVTDWYAPELVANHILFASETDQMTVYNYIMAFNLEGLETKSGLDELNDLFDEVVGVDGIIFGYADTDKYPTDTFANLSTTCSYLFYISDIDYIKKLAAAHNEVLKDGDDPVYSDNTLSRLQDYVDVKGDWAKFKDYSHKVNGKTVYANQRDYYYTMLGKMTDRDAEDYAEAFKTEFLVSWPEEEETPTWFEGLSTVERVFFIIGMCLAGLLVIAGITVLTIFIVRKTRKNKLPSYAKRRIKVDTTDDKNINVYEDEPTEPTE